MIDLHPDLQACLHNDIINHPLLRIRYWSPGDNRRINSLYNLKRKAAEQARSQGDWDTFIALHLYDHREIAFFNHCEEMSKSDYYRIGGNIWTDPEIINNGSCFVTSIIIPSDSFETRRPIMSQEENAAYDALPENMIIYRAQDWRGPDGCCWTLDRSIALEYAKGYNWPRFITGRVFKSDVLAIFLRRGEQEIIAYPSKVSAITKEDLDLKTID